MEATKTTQYDPKEDYDKGWRADFGHNQMSVLISPTGVKNYTSGSHERCQKWGALRAYQSFREKEKGGSNG